MPFFIEKGDLVSKNVDCIVNASNIKLSMVEGVGRAIFHKAGDTILSNACKKIGHCNVGDAVTTPAFGIENTKLLIHAVGPIYINSKHGEEAALRSAYKKSLDICVENNFNSIAFPLLSQEFNYPLRECCFIGCDEILNYLKDHKELNVYMVIYKNFPELLKEDKQAVINKYICDNQSLKVKQKESKLKFNVLLRNYIEESQKEFDEIAYNSNIKPSVLKAIVDGDVQDINKETIFGLAIGLELNLEQTNELLISKGFVFNSSIVSDLLFSYFVTNKNYNLFELNYVLFSYGYKAIGCEL